jgi:hypothetical protein
VLRLPLAGLACALLLTAAGCSDDEEPESKRTPATVTTEAAAPPPRGLSAAEYRRKLNALCVADKRLAESVEEPSTADGFGPYLRRLLDLFKRREPKYRALEPPPALRRDHQASLDLGDETQKALEGAVERLEGGRDPAVELPKILTVLARSIDEGNKLARRLGARKCIAEVPSPATQPEESVS